MLQLPTTTSRGRGVMACRRGSSSGPLRLVVATPRRHSVGTASILFKVAATASAPPPPAGRTASPLTSGPSSTSLDASSLSAEWFPVMAITGAALRPAARTMPAGWYQWLFLAASAWLVGGAYLDNWAHAHIATLDTFFTPWHGALYSGFAACATVLGVRWL